MPDVRSKALGYLRDGRVTLLTVNTAKHSLRPYAVGAMVQGFQGRYWVRLNAQGWLCSCALAECAHAAAVQLVTGWPSAASKDAKAAEVMA
ncbi:hypothetical protein [Streptosporangium canum]|uniref:hypothetical protein n=1 Tax=Streptosporangium canum TaxID=324952 RepID=UPI0037B7BE3C